MIVAHAEEGQIWRWLDLGRHFLLWLFLGQPAVIWRGWRRTAADFEAQLAVVTTAKNIGRPLFQDYTREGRLIGFFFRLGRIAAGILIQILLAALFASLALAWYALPFYLLWQISRQIIGILF